MAVEVQQLMGSLLETDSDERCEWMLGAFLETFGAAPDVILPDEGAGMLCAIPGLGADTHVIRQNRLP